MLEQEAVKIFPIVFLLFCNLKIPKQGIKLQIFFLNGLWRLLKNSHLPVKLHSNAPRVILQERTNIGWLVRKGWFIQFDFRLQRSYWRESIFLLVWPSDLSKVCKVVMLKSCLFFLSHPKLWAPYKDLNIFKTPFAFSRFLFWKGDHLLVLRVLEIKGSLGLRFGVPFCCEHFGLCCESFAFAVNFLICVVNILVCAVSYLLLLWISWFVMWVICHCCEYFGLCCELFVIAVNILVCDASNLLLLWQLWATVHKSNQNVFHRYKYFLVF